MRTIHKIKFPFFLLMLFLIVIGLSALAFDLSLAQEPQPQRPDRSDAPEAISDFFPVQGYLTDENGFPLNGDQVLTMRLYDASSGGTALCEDTRTISVVDGLFSKYMNASTCPMDGRQLYLSLEVNSDGEMTPRQFVDPVPYAWTLRPGATIEYARGSALLNVSNLSNGPGLVAESASGPAIRASGTGIIQSTAPTYLWISGNGARPYMQADSTIIDMDNKGGAMIYRGAAAGNKNIMLPITVPGTQYGQTAQVTGLDVYWSGQTEFDGVTAVLLRRQTGACPNCYASILFDTSDRSCAIAAQPAGCIQHFDLTTNNTLSSSSGVLYLTIEFSFSGASTWINLGGVRLTLEYDG